MINLSKNSVLAWILIVILLLPIYQPAGICPISSRENLHDSNTPETNACCCEVSTGNSCCNNMSEKQQQTVQHEFCNCAVNTNSHNFETIIIPNLLDQLLDNSVLIAILNLTNNFKTLSKIDVAYDLKVKTQPIWLIDSILLI